MDKRLTISAALQELNDAEGETPFMKLFEHGTLEIEIYKPDKVDNQTPHTRDELYVVATGSGKFINGDETHDVEPGEVLFVPAGVEHRFIDFHGRLFDMGLLLRPRRWRESLVELLKHLLGTRRG